jgi:hypothetical protein
MKITGGASGYRVSLMHTIYRYIRYGKARPIIDDKSSGNHGERSKGKGDRKNELPSDAHCGTSTDVA